MWGGTIVEIRTNMIEIEDEHTLEGRQCHVGHLKSVVVGSIIKKMRQRNNFALSV